MPQPPAILARKTLDWAIRVGKARRWSCFSCCRTGSMVKPRFEDPSKPLAVLWYCDRCYGRRKRDQAEAQRLAIEKAKRDLSLRSARERLQMVLCDLENSPTLKAELTQCVRQRLRPDLAFMDENCPLFRQLLAYVYLAV